MQAQPIVMSDREIAKNPIKYSHTLDEAIEATGIFVSWKP